MKKLSVLILLALGVAALACTHNNLQDPTQTTTNGQWEAHLYGSDGSASEIGSQLSFVIGFDVTNTNGGTSEPLTFTSFGFINLQSCFVTQSYTGSTDLTTNTENQVSGTINLTITSTSPTGNQLALTSTDVSGSTNGAVYTTMTNGVVTGTWQLTGGSGCTGSGTFLMCQGAATCIAP